MWGLEQRDPPSYSIIFSSVVKTSFRVPIVLTSNVQLESSYLFLPPDNWRKCPGSRPRGTPDFRHFPDVFPSRRPSGIIERDVPPPLFTPREGTKRTSGQ